MKIICVGRNYPEHVTELNNDRLKEPVLFIKPDSSILQDRTPFVIPEFSRCIHFEVEFILRFHRLGRHIEQKFANNYYHSVSLGIDFTARDLQANLKLAGLPWEKAKSFDRSAVIGKWIDKREFEDIHDINFQLIKNGTVVQEGNTSQMLWKIDDLISYCSKFFMIKIGDVLFTGTPAGVGKVSSRDQYVGLLDNREVFKVSVL